MSPIQQMLLGAGGAVATKTYMDDVFSTFLYTGNGSYGVSNNLVNNNGINLSEEGGLVWIKARSAGDTHCLYDTVRGVTKQINSNYSAATTTTSSDNTKDFVSFNSNGFTLGSPENTGNINANNTTYSSWSFRKAPGFFDVVTYSGSGSYKTVAHSLGCVPGMYMIKRTDTGSSDWRVFHRGLFGPGYRLVLNTNEIQNDLYSLNQNTGPTSSVFSVGSDSTVNDSSGTYVCYLFAGGESIAATARSVDVGSGDSLSIPDDNDWNLGQTFTIEAWVRPDNFDSNYNTIVAQAAGENNWYFSLLNTGKCQFYDFSGSKQIDGDFALQTKVWTHIAFVSNSGTGQWYVNGEATGAAVTGINVAGGAGGLTIGRQGTSWPYDGKISNLRIVNGTAVYTSSFRPPTEPLTNITNTVLLCCNNSSVTGSTVTPGTITNSGVTASSDSPFDDPAGYVFGESGSESVIKTGEYLGRGSALNPVVFLGFEPQFIMIKNISSTGPWLMYDSIRGLVTGGDDSYLQANENNAEVTNTDYLKLTPTGFEINTSNSNINEEWSTYVFLAIRRPDGYVGKPPELGTSVFAMDTGNSSSTEAFTSNFPVDFALTNEPANSGDWGANARLIQTKNLVPNNNTAESTWSAYTFDSNTGWLSNNAYTSDWQSWMWKRHAGFDVVTDTGGGVAKSIPHSLGKVPEMIWRKSRSNAHGWTVYHKGLNGGTTPQNYWLQLSSTDAEGDADNVWNDTAPTSTHFTVGNGQWASDNGATFITMLFASVAGISKVGSYTGNTSSATNSVTTGFQPRFVILKRTDSATEGDWYVYDTTRNWVSLGSNSQRLQLNNDDAQANCGTCVEPTSTGFNLGSSGRHNTNNGKYIYYAHA